MNDPVSVCVCGRKNAQYVLVLYFFFALILADLKFSLITHKAFGCKTEPRAGSMRKRQARECSES